MYEKGNLVVYQAEGVCTVIDITTLDWVARDQRKNLYYILEPKKNPGSRVYCPVDNKKVIMRSVMTKDEAESLIRSMPTMPALTVENEKVREEAYKSAMRTGRAEDLVRMMKTLYERRKARVESGKKMTSTDDRYYKTASALLYEELAFALGITQKDLEGYIEATLESPVQ